MASGDTLVVWTALDGIPAASNYPQIVFRNQHPVLAFDTTTQETVNFEAKMPQNYAGGNLVVYVTSSAATAPTGTIGWDATFETFGTAQTVTAATVNGTSGIVTTSSVTCTAGAAGTDSVAAGDPFRLRIRRDVANDTAAGDADLHMVEVREA